MRQSGDADSWVPYPRPFLMANQASVTSFVIPFHKKKIKKERLD